MRNSAIPCAVKLLAAQMFPVSSATESLVRLGAFSKRCSRALSRRGQCATQMELREYLMSELVRACSALKLTEGQPFKISCFKVVTLAMEHTPGYESE